MSSTDDHKRPDGANSVDGTEGVEGVDGVEEPRWVERLKQLGAIRRPGRPKGSKDKKKRKPSTPKQTDGTEQIVAPRPRGRPKGSKNLKKRKPGQYQNKKPRLVIKRRNGKRIHVWRGKGSKPRKAPIVIERSSEFDYQDCLSCKLCSSVEVRPGGAPRANCTKQGYFDQWGGIRGLPASHNGVQLDGAALDLVKIAKKRANPGRKRGWYKDTHDRIVNKKLPIGRYPNIVPPRDRTEGYVGKKKKKLKKRNTSLYEARREYESPETIMSPSPRIVTAAKFGPNVLARPYFPEIFEAPDVNITEEEAIRLTQEEQIKQLVMKKKVPLDTLRDNFDEIARLAQLLDDSLNAPEDEQE